VGEVLSTAAADPFDTGLGPLGSAPAAPAGCDFAVREGTDGALWYADPTGGTSWQCAVRIGMGPLDGQPSATAWGNAAGAALGAFWEGIDCNLWEARPARRPGRVREPAEQVRITIRAAAVPAEQLL
jgi:hypothetical protein